jgi:hypothetical protein
VNYTITDTVSGANGYTVRHATVKALDAVWSATRGLLYLAVPASAPDHPNTITEFDPATGTVGASIAAGMDPTELALSDNDEFLYVSERGDNAVRRYKTAPLMADISIPLGLDTTHPTNYPLFAKDLSVQPGHPHTIAVRRSNLQFSPDARGAALFDDAVQRPNIAFPNSSPSVGYITWDPDGSRMFTYGYILNLDSTGFTTTVPMVQVPGRIRYANGKLYAERGQVVDVAANTSVDIPLEGYPDSLTIDAATNRLYYLTSSQQNIGHPMIEVFNLTTLARIGSATLPQFQGVGGWTARFARYGTNGLIITYPSGDVILVNGPLVVP